MQMQVENRLARPAAGVENSPVAIREIPLARELRGDEHDLSEQGLILRLRFVKRREMFPRAQENVRRRLGVDVLEREDVGVLIDKRCGDLFCGNLAKQAVCAH
jgi:hypothetical protein